MVNSKDIFTNTSGNFYNTKKKMNQTNLSDSFNEIQETLNLNQSNTNYMGGAYNETGFSMGNSLFSQTAQSFNEIKKKKLYDVVNQSKKIGFNNFSNKENMI